MKVRTLALIAVASCLAMTGCKGKEPGKKTYTYNTYTTTSPANWNELTYRDANDTQILNYIVSSFFEFDFKFDSNNQIVEGAFDVDFSAAEKLEDVTSEQAGKYGIAASGAKNQAYKITLRDNLKWDNGDPIVAGDFVYSMQQQLDPLFQNYRASSFYQNNIVIHGAKDYVFQGSHAYTKYMVDEAFENYIDKDAIKTYDPEGFGYKDEDGNFYDIAFKLNDGGRWTSKSFMYYYDYYIANGVYYNGHYGYFSLGMAVDENGYSYFYKIGDATETVVLIYNSTEGKAYDVTDENNPVELVVAPLEDGSDIEFKNAAGEVVYTRKTMAPVVVNYESAENLLAAANDDGIVVLTEELKQDVVNIGWFLNGYDDYDAYVAEKGDYANYEWQEWCFLGEDVPAYDWKDVGIFAPSDKELVLCLDKPLVLLNDDGTLNYRAAYMMGSLPLVHKKTFEANKHEPATGATLWTSTYNSDLASTRSWGPYKLTSYQVDKEYVLEKNENWFGYQLDQYKGLYQTDKIVCETVPDWNTAWLKFQNGDAISIGIDVSIADDYKASQRAVYTPGDSVWSFQIQSSEEALKARETEGYDKEIIANQKFRKALSLGLNRAEYAATCFTADLPSLSLFNSLHYYDVENGGQYTSSTAWKEMICRFYNVDPSKFESLDDAIDSITGYDMKQAKELLTAAYEETKAAGKISDNDKVLITFGVSTNSTSYQRIIKYLSEAFVELAKETPLQGRIECETKEFGSKWSTAFKEDGSYDIAPAAGWTGSAWDIPGLMDAYLNPDYMYSASWDTDHEMLKLTVKGEELEMSVRDWNNCLMGETDAPRNFSEGYLDPDERLMIIAAIEEVVLEKAYSVPTVSDYSAALLSYKVEYITREYNTFVGYGGIKYLKYNYDDAAWEKIKTTFDYKL